MSYKYTTDLACTLSNLEQDADIKQLSNAIFPGTHCPLFGALMISSYIKELAVLIVGTEECTFYGKDFSYSRQKGKDRVYSLVINKKDITFGFHEKIETCILDIEEQVCPEALLIISTCVVELIGEDITAIVNESKEKVKMHLMCVKTEHFKCNSHIPGMRDTLDVLTDLMVHGKTNENKVNILGHRFEGFESTELYNLFKEKKVLIHMSIPSKSSIEELKTAANVKLNIVTDFTAIKLAQAMKEKFDVPYVVFERYLSPERILNNYLEIERVLGINIKEEVTKLYNETLEQVKELKLELEGKTFIYGNTPMKALEFSEFLCQVGLEPTWIQMRELYEDDPEYIKEILSYDFDPKVSRIANIMPMRTVYDELKPDYYIGHENPMELMKRNIIQLTFDSEAKGLGFELPKSVMEKLKNVKSPSLDAMQLEGNKPLNVMKMMNMANKNPKELAKLMKEFGSKMPKGHKHMMKGVKK